MTARRKKRQRELDKRLREAQENFASLAPSEVSLVDELLKERREEVAREDQEEREWLRASRSGHTAAKPPTDN